MRLVPAAPEVEIESGRAVFKVWERWGHLSLALRNRFGIDAILERPAI